MAVRTPSIRFQSLGKRFRHYHNKHQSLKTVVLNFGRGRFDEFWALREVTFDIDPGETFGLVGHNGSGKSTALRCVCGILLPDEGTVSTNGRVSSLLELGAGFHPELSGRENVYLNGTFFGFSRQEINARMDEIVEFSGLGRFVDRPVKTYSSGMHARLGFSIAIHVDPEILLVDEVLAVGDEEFQRRCMERIVEFRRDGRTIVFVSHSMPVVQMLCDRVAWLDHGRLRALGDPGDIVGEYLHEVTTSVAGRGGRSEGSWIDVVEMLDGDGRPTSSLATGDPMAVRISWDAPQSLAAPVVHVEIARADIAVFATNTKVAGLELDLPAGPGSIEFRIPAFHGLPASYTVTALISEHWGRHVVTENRNATGFVVTDGVDRGAAGVFATGGTWRGVAVRSGRDRSAERD